MAWVDPKVRAYAKKKKMQGNDEIYKFIVDN